MAAVAAGMSVSGAPASASAPVAVAPANTLEFTSYVAPEGSSGAHLGDEPSIGVDWKTGAVMYQALTSTYRVAFDDTKSPAAATWTDVSAPLTSQQTLDPILFTDSTTGRTIVSQLAGECSLSEYSDDDGATWTPDEGCGPPSGVDHQSVGGGPFAILPANPVYPDAVYYCSQAVATAFCALSADGGLTYATGVPIYSLAQCGGLHGHVRVAPDGTAIVPNQDCDPSPSTAGATGSPGAGLDSGTFTNQAAVVSTDDGATWSVNVIPGSVATIRSDPAAAADRAGKWYFADESAVLDGTGEQVGGHALVSMSTDDGSTWSPGVDVGAPLGIRNVTFPEIIAGDSGRAAYAFLGSTTAGDPENQTFKGFWYLYVAMTYDGGQSWTVENLTPGDPVERGCIFLAGSGDCPSPAKRNLYDFMDISTDAHGRALIGYSDGCTGKCDSEQSLPCDDAACDKGDTASTDHRSSIARLTCGRGLFAADDAALACATTASSSSPATVGRVAAATAGLHAIPNTSAGGTSTSTAGTAAAALAVLIGAGARRRRRTRRG